MELLELLRCVYVQRMCLVFSVQQNRLLNFYLTSLSWFDTLPPYVSLAATSVSFLLVLWLAHNWKEKRRKTNLSLQYSAIQSLSQVFTPSIGGWPCHLVLHFSNSRLLGKTIELDLAQLWNSVVSGSIEIGKLADLGKLFGRSLEYDDWDINIGTTSSTRVALLKWMVSQQLLSSQHVRRQNLPF